MIILISTHKYVEFFECLFFGILTQAKLHFGQVRWWWIRFSKAILDILIVELFPHQTLELY